MKQFLRSFLTLLMLVVWCSGFAQEVTLDFTDNSVWKFPTTAAQTDVTKSNGAYSVTIESGVYYNSKDKYLMLAKDKSITLSAFDFDVDKIVVTTTAGSSGYAWSNVFVNNTAVSTKQEGNGKLEFVIDDKFKTSGNVYTLTTFKNTKKKKSYNIQIQKIEIYKKTATKTLTFLAISGEPNKKAYNAGEAFDPTGLVVTGTYDDASTATITDGITWTKTPATLTVGTTSCSVTATVNGVTSPAYDVTGLTVKKAITLSIDPATSTVVKAPVKVTLTADAGATIYYTLNGDTPSTSSTKYDAPFEVTTSGTTVKALAVAEGAENAKAEATYTIKPDQPVFSDESKTFKDAFDVTLSLPESTDANSTIHYAIGATATADSPLYKGPINISAEKDGAKVILHAVVVDQYGNVGMEKRCTYTKTTSFIFNFTGDWEGITPLSKNDDANAANVVAGKELKVGGIVMTATNGTNSDNTTTLTTCLYGSTNDHNLRVYTNGSITFTAPEGYNISEVTFSTKSAAFETTVGTYGKSNSTWTGDAHVVTFKATDKVKVDNATIKLVAAATTPLTLDEATTAEDATVILGENLNKTINVTINRTLVANKWNTLCLPFDVTAEQIKNILKAEGMVREYKDQTADCINFQAAETMTAGVPYLIKPTEEVKGLTFEGVKITADKGKTKGGIGSENLTICGILGAHKLGDFELFLNAAGKFVAPAPGKETMKGFRAYFISLISTNAKINIDGETTDINNIETEATVNGKVYNLNGQYVGNSLNGLKKGIYVVNGKKVIK